MCNKYKLILTVKDSEDHDKWLSTRNSGIGGSDAGIIMGLNPYKSLYELWLEKTGAKEPDDLSNNERVYWGTQLEDLVAKEFAKRTSYEVRRIGTVQSVEHPFMIANIDRWIVGRDFGLECKTAGAYADKDWQDDEVPVSYYCQCLHYMAVTGAPCWYIAALIGGNKFVYKKIERNEDDIKALIAEEKKFWEMVKTNTPPPIDGTMSCGNALKWKYKGDPGSETMLPEEAGDIINELDKDAEVKKALKESIQLKRNRLMEMMGDFEVGRIGDRKVTWKVTKGRESISLSRIKKEDKGSYEALKAAGLITMSEPSRTFRVW